MIVCIGPNPSLDRTVVIDQLQIGQVHRSTQSIAQAGGKAANVARTLGVLDARSRLLGIVGGGIGAEIADLAEQEGLDCGWAHAAPSTRVCLTMVSPGGVVTDINEAGRVDAAGWDSFLQLVSSEVIGASVVLLCGSFPDVDGAGGGDAVDSLLAAIGNAAPLWVDTSGPALRRLLDSPHRLAMVKVNQSEAAAALGLDLSTATPPVAGAALAEALAARSGGAAVVTLGERGAVARFGDATTTGVLSVADVVNPTGSGDAFFGGLACGLVDRGTPMTEALSLALACGASNAQQLPAGQPDAAHVARLLSDVRVTQAN